MLKKSIEDYKNEMLEMHSKSVMAVAPLPQYPVDENDSGQGRLIVILTTARGAYPLSGGEIRVYESGTKNMISTLRTDESGRTSAVPLSAPRRILSESPSVDNSAIFALYDIVASRTGFETTTINSVPIFDGVTSLQTVDMLASSAASQGGGTNSNTQNTYQL